ncbi:MAG: HRDC domain-containing protein [Planctomycetes bacterium]|nr:HRDC domain-containing protein [Planctomycetota bacterium]
MRVKLFTFRYSATIGGFDDSPLAEFTRDKEVLQFREHFFVLNDVPHLACVLTYQEAVVDAATLSQAREIASRPARFEGPGRGHRPGPAPALDERARAIWASLRAWRAATAREEGVPAYVVFTDREMTEIVVRRPDSLTALGHVPGVGPQKVKRYGSRILEILGDARGSPATLPAAEPPPPAMTQEATA